MKLRRIAGTCVDDDCPTVYLSDRGTVVVQGYKVNEGVKLAADEQAVEIPLSLLRDAAQGLD
jgi:uncharacterized protein YbcV (DUF1398 family)